MRHERGDQLGGRDQTLVQRPIGVELVGVLLVAAPVAVAAAAEIPVAQGVDELDDLPTGAEVVVGVHPLGHRRGGLVQFADDPAIQFAALRHRTIRLRGCEVAGVQLFDFARDLCPRVESVDVGVDHEEAVTIPQPQQKLRDALLDRLLAIANARPRRLIGEEIPAQRVGPVTIENLVRRQVIPLALRHLLPIFAQHQAEHDAIAEGMGEGEFRFQIADFRFQIV